MSETPYYKDGIFFAAGEKIFLRRDGVWIADGVEISHEGTRELFYRSVFREKETSRYYLQIGIERLFITVEDTAFFVVSIEKASAYSAKLSNGKTLSIEPAQLSYVEDVVRGPSLYLLLEDGERARFLSPAYYALLSHAVDEDDKYGIWLGNIYKVLRLKL